MLLLSELPPKIDQKGFVPASVPICAVDEMTVSGVVASDTVSDCEVEADTGTAVVCGCVIVVVVCVSVRGEGASVTVKADVLSVTRTVVVAVAEKAVVSSGFADEQPLNTSRTARRNGKILIFFNLVSSEKINVLSLGKDAVVTDDIAAETIVVKHFSLPKSEL